MLRVCFPFAISEVWTVYVSDVSSVFKVITELEYDLSTLEMVTEVSPCFTSSSIVVTILGGSFRVSIEDLLNKSPGSIPGVAKILSIQLLYLHIFFISGYMPNINNLMVSQHQKVTACWQVCNSCKSNPQGRCVHCCQHFS